MNKMFAAFAFVAIAIAMQTVAWADDPLPIVAGSGVWASDSFESTVTPAEDEEESGVSVTISTGYTTSYITDFGMKGADDSWQTEVELAFKNGLYVGAFYNYGFVKYPGGEEEADWGKELDPVAGYTWELFGLAWDASITYWDCWRVLNDSKCDTLYPAFEVSKELKISDSQTLTPSFRVAFPISMSDEGDNGTHLFGKLTHGLQLSEKTSLESGVSLVRDDGGVGLLPGWLSELGCVASYQLTDNLSINAGVRGILLLSDGMKEKGVREDDVIFATNLVFEF